MLQSLASFGVALGEMRGEDGIYLGPPSAALGSCRSTRVNHQIGSIFCTIEILGLTVCSI